MHRHDDSQSMTLHYVCLCIDSHKVFFVVETVKFEAKYFTTLKHLLARPIDSIPTACNKAKEVIDCLELRLSLFGITTGITIQKEVRCSTVQSRKRSCVSICSCSCSRTCRSWIAWDLETLKAWVEYSYAVSQYCCVTLL